METRAKETQRKRRHGRIRARISGTAKRPRLAVFRSNRYIYAQLIDDETATTLAYASSQKSSAKTGIDQAREVGSKLAQQAKTKKITEVVFDRSGFLFAGRIKAVADGAREGGLNF